MARTPTADGPPHPASAATGRTTAHEQAPALRACGVVKEWDVRVLHGIDLEVPAGQHLAVMGPSGSGKSTLLAILAGMDVPTAGTVELAGEGLNGLGEDALAALRLRRIGFVFQTTRFVRTLDLADNVALPGLIAADRPRREVLVRADELMERMGVADVAHHAVTEVSGGQLQRAALCRALINDPDIVLGDEPTGALDSASAALVLDLLASVNAEGRTLVLVTHDAAVAARADRVVVLGDGAIAQDLVLGRDDATDRPGRLDTVRRALAAHGM